MKNSHKHLRTLLLIMGFALVIAACSAPVKLSDAPNVHAAPAPIVEAIAESTRDIPIYPVWYGTNRLPVVENNNVVGYTDFADSDRTHHGRVPVSIPEDFLENVRNQGWFSSLLGTAETKLRVGRPEPFSEVAFLQNLQNHFGQYGSDDKIALIYLHGFNTTFEEAAQRAASIGYQLKVPVTAFFSWPSRGATVSYLTDKDAAQNSEDKIARFIVKVKNETGANTVHIIAHSMGSYALLRAMYRPAMQDAIRNGLRFGQVILAAPDVDNDFFTGNIRIFDNVAARVTLYASSGDKALNFSRTLANRPRAGLRPPILVVPGVDTIDVSSVNLTFLGHAYISDEIVLMQDMTNLIYLGMPPSRRARIEPRENYWVLR